jgi:hypothetical protein
MRLNRWIVAVLVGVVLSVSALVYGQYKPGTFQIKADQRELDGETMQFRGNVEFRTIWGPVITAEGADLIRHDNGPMTVTFYGPVQMYIPHHYVVK